MIDIFWYSKKLLVVALIKAKEAFTRFELRREMTKTGIFKAIQPF
jgi:hypothetical protein